MKTFLVSAFSLFAFVSCANIGSPDGGRYDEEPPLVVHSLPANKAVGSKHKKIDIRFNEYIKLENASEKVVISPPQVEMPNVRAVGKSVKIDLYDNLRPNTTYTIDFSDAIVDNNEGNPMGKYTFSFSTGAEIDTMEVSGTVLNAQDLEPVKGILVGLYSLDSLWSDTLFTSQPLLRVGRTNGSGQFTIKGVRDGRYRAFALQDMDGNYFFSQKSEAIAWDTLTILTRQHPAIRPDTVWADTVHIEKIRMVPYIHYLPDNLVLRAFLEGGQAQHLLKTERPTPDAFTLFFTAPQDTLPTLQGLNFDARSLLPEPSLRNDTITYWITDTLTAYADTLSFALTYPDTDTTGLARLRTDTLSLVPKLTQARRETERRKKSEEWLKERAKEQRRSKTPLPPMENPHERTYLDVQVRPAGALDPNQNVTLTFSQPVTRADSTRLRLSIKIDSTYRPEPFLLLPVEGNLRQYRLYAEWQPTKTYRLEADSLAFEGALGHHSKRLRTDFRVRSEEEFGSLFVQLVGDEEPCIVQLLNRSDKPVATIAAQDGRADFFYLKPGEYYLRLFVDRNGNGQWDTGEYATGTQPEEVFYFPRPLPIRQRFEVEQQWHYRAINPTRQKPKEITKQKADKEKTVKDRNREREQNKQQGR